jgi:uncharacterized protein YdbL (DUF1318 family)
MIGETYTGYLQLLKRGLTPAEKDAVGQENLRRLEHYRLVAAQRRKVVGEVGEEEATRIRQNLSDTVFRQVRSRNGDWDWHLPNGDRGEEEIKTGVPVDVEEPTEPVGRDCLNWVNN